MLRRLSGAALLPPAALAVHELRYLVVYGAGAGAELQRTGHSYLHSVVPWIVLLVALTVGGFLRSLGQALSGQTSLPRYTTSFVGLWLACAACLVGIFVCQECLEGLFATGHPTGLAGTFGYGGWWSVPAALAVGLVIAAGFHGARWVLGEIVRRRSRIMVVRRAPAIIRTRPNVLVPRLAPLAGGWPTRGPPR